MLFVKNIEIREKEVIRCRHDRVFETADLRHFKCGIQHVLHASPVIVVYATIKTTMQWQHWKTRLVPKTDITVGKLCSCVTHEFHRALLEPIFVLNCMGAMLQ